MMNTDKKAVTGSRTVAGVEKAKGQLLEAIAILAEVGIIDQAEEERLQDRLETLF